MRVVPIWKKYVVGLPLGSTFPFSVTVVCPMLAAAPVVTAGFAALAVAGATSATATAINMAPRNMNPSIDDLPLIQPATTRHRAQRLAVIAGFPPPTLEPCAQPLGGDADGEPDAHGPAPSPS